MQIKAKLVNAFTKNSNGGNPAWVIMDADKLSEAKMIEISAKLGFSESAFVQKSNKADFRIRFFSPTQEVDLCGHATIATWNLLRDLKIIKKGHYSMETNVGILNIEVTKKEVYMQQKKPEFLGSIEQFELYDCFYEERFLDATLPPMIVSTGLKEIFVPIKDVETLNKLHPKLKNIEHLSKKYDVIGIHIFAVAKDCDAYGRNFAPIVGIDEESATGTSNGALACYLNKYVSPQKEEYILRQGYSMKQPSEIKVKLDKHLHEILSVSVGGSAKLLK